MRGDLDFNQSIAERVAMLKGTREDILLEIMSLKELSKIILTHTSLLTLCQMI